MRVPKLGTVALLAIAVAVTMIVAPLSAQPGRGKARPMPKYDTAAEKTLEGKVQEVVEKESASGWKGIHLMLQSGDSIYEIHVGPKTFLNEKDVSFAAGDELIVVGARSMGEEEGSKDLIAREITKEDEKLVLRDEKGAPLWRGTGARGRGGRRGTH